MVAAPLDFNVRVWFAVQAGVAESRIRVTKAIRTADGGWEFGVERAGHPIGAVLVSGLRQRIGDAEATRLVVATWGDDESATLEVDADRPFVWS